MKALERLIRTPAPKPKQLSVMSVMGSGALHSEQQFCYEKGWKEGIAAFRKHLREHYKGIEIDSLKEE